MFCRQKPFGSERLSEFQRRLAQEIYVVQLGDRLLCSVNFLTGLSLRKRVFNGPIITRK